MVNPAAHTHMPTVGRGAWRESTDLIACLTRYQSSWRLICQKLLTYEVFQTGHLLESLLWWFMTPYPLHSWWKWHNSCSKKAGGYCGNMALPWTQTAPNNYRQFSFPLPLQGARLNTVLCLFVKRSCEFKHLGLFDIPLNLIFTKICKFRNYNCHTLTERNYNCHTLTELISMLSVSYFSFYLIENWQAKQWYITSYLCGK